MSWYRDGDGKIITDEEFQNDCCECSAFCSEGTITIPCNGERTDCPHFKEVDTSDYDKEIQSKAISNFADWCYINGIDFSYMSTFDKSGRQFIDDVIARYCKEQIKEVGENEQQLMG